MIISFLNQKGGTGKSSLARAVAVEFLRNKWQVHVADMDLAQSTTFNWAGRREEAGFLPPVDVALYREPKSALKAATLTDLLIVDGKAFADSHIADIAIHSDLVVLPVGFSVDDLEPTLKLAMELIKKGVKREALFFVVCKVTKNGEKEAMNTRASIEEWGFSVAQGWIAMQTAYSQAMDSGKAFTETKYKELNKATDNIIQQIADRAIKTVNKEG